MTLGPIEEELAKARGAYRNWGRWGENDVLGTLNFLDDAKRAHAAGLVRRGRPFSLAQEFNEDGPQRGFRGRINPVHYMKDTGTDAASESQGFPHGFGGADDHVVMPLQASTQWDGLGHIFDRKRAWNGRPCTIVDGAGDHVTGIEHMADRFVGRGVLLDVGRAFGDPGPGRIRSREDGSAEGHRPGPGPVGSEPGRSRAGSGPVGSRADGSAEGRLPGGELPDGFAIHERHLLATIEAQGPTSTVRRGDIVLVRTGQLARCRRDGWGEYAAGPAPGLSFTTLGWLHRTEIAAAATDTWGFEVRPYEFDGPCMSPLHQIAIPNMGLPLGEMFDLEELADDCAADGVYEFLLIAAPLPVTGAVGAPVNPIAVK
ncbi:cyclase family protein [Actinoallomurus sp. CA-150999]|uniref:cyclase family protein n=1 Tax=Actinoallomurus sp. CA-150999 TaxID=3239887 RepID=UPI003D8C29F1